MDILSRPVLRADHRVPYGSDPSQFGDLWLPEPRPQARVPLVVFFHGGWWKSEYDLGYAGFLCSELKREGIATWSVEYRRVGSTGGGWPATFRDAGAGFDFVAELAKIYPLDLSRVITMGHSAGGHLAFWVAGRHHVSPGSEVFMPVTSIPLRGVVGLAGDVDLRLTIELAGDGIFAHDKGEVYSLMGGDPRDFAERYDAGNPGDLLPFQAEQILIQGTADDQIPPDLPSRWVQRSKSLGSHARLRMLPGAGHFDIVDPQSVVWAAVLAELRSLLH